MTKITTTGVRVDNSLTALNEIAGGDVISQTDKKFVLDLGNRTMTFAGSGLTYDGGGDVMGGVITRITSSKGVVMNDLSVSAVAVFDAIQAHNGTTLSNILFSGKDRLEGSGLGDALYGYGGRDFLIGNAGNDVMSGGDGADRFVGGLGADTLTGGAGNDVFIYLALSDSPETDGQRDRLSGLTNTDVIDLSAIDADTTQDGDQAFHRVNAFTGEAGELIARYSSGYGTGGFFVDVDGDMAADMIISFSGDHRDFTNFVL